MNIIEALGKRRSIRTYKPDTVPRDLLMTILEAAQMAPSACNKQNWQFIIIEDDSLKQKLVKMGAAIFIKNAPVGILVLYDNRTQNIEYSDHIQSGAAAIQNMLIAASDLGIGACWVCHLPPKRQLRKLFNIPWHLDPIAYIPMGYPKISVHPTRPRKCNIQHLISYNQFNATEDIPKRSVGTILRIILIKIYYLLPMRFKNLLHPFIDKNIVTKFK